MKNSKKAEPASRRSSISSRLLLERAEEIRTRCSAQLDPLRRTEYGQFLTPRRIASFMAGMFQAGHSEVRALDAGAGTGSLTAALVAALGSRKRRPRRILVDAFEVDPDLATPLEDVLEACREFCGGLGIEFRIRLHRTDFIEYASERIAGKLFAGRLPADYNCAILNPPYRKISANSRERRLLRMADLETSNLYAAFVGLAARLLVSGGEMVAITPRSFCNGTYFAPFRRFLLKDMRFRGLHVFEERSTAFAEDRVLQENIIFHAVRGGEGKRVLVSSGSGAAESPAVGRRIPHEEIVQPGDADLIIRIAPRAEEDIVRDRMLQLSSRLPDLNLSVSTGRVVDFRVRDRLRALPGDGTVPLIYPAHFSSGFVEWPKAGIRKPNALSVDGAEDDLMLPSGQYVLVKRFSAKEERRRVVAALYDASRVGRIPVAFENHLSYFHSSGMGMDGELGKGLTVWMNSTIVDTYFRQFSGHTQVNAGDLRSLPYPSLSALKALGASVGDAFPVLGDLDRLVERLVFQV